MTAFLDWLVPFLYAAMLAGVPLLFGTLGEIITQKAGNLNLGVEGMMYMGAVFGFMGGYFFQSPALALTILVALYGIILATIVQAWLTSRTLRKALEAKFGDAGLAKGNLMYGIMRSMQIRRSRLPKPVVKRGEHPSWPRKG